MTNDLKGCQWWQKKNNVAVRELNDNINHKNVVVIWISFADKVKYFCW